MNKTPIDWVKNPDGTQGYTWNPITGCLNNCSYCYARKLANTRLRERYLTNKNIAVEGIKLYQREGEVSQNTVIRAHNDPFYPRFWVDRCLEFTTIREKGCYQKPKGIFVCDMGELFGDWVPTEWQRQVFDIIFHNPDHRFYLLTKQPQNLIKFSPFPDNCFVGVTATNEKQFDNAIKYLKEIVAKVKYISIEPYLERINPHWLDIYLKDAGISWVILGSQTKPYKPPKIEHIQEIVQACENAGIPVFLKENLGDLIPVNSCLRYGPAGELRLRQEFPV